MIGVVSQAITPDLKEAYPEIAADYNSFIQADIVHFLNGSGARVVPIVDTESGSETASKLELLNGVVFPGGWPLTDYKTKAK